MVNEVHNQIKDNFTIFNNEILLDKNISPRQLKTFLYLLSLPQGWSVNNKDVMKKMGIKDPHTIAKDWKALEKAGYIIREKKIKNGLLSGYKYTLLLPSRILSSGMLSNNTPSGMQLDGMPSDRIYNNTNKEQNLSKEDDLKKSSNPTFESINSRKDKFIARVRAVQKEKESLLLSELEEDKFIAYWTEISDGGRKMLFEKQLTKRTFNVKSRMNRWKLNAEKWSKQENKKSVVHTQGDNDTKAKTIVI